MSDAIEPSVERREPDARTRRLAGPRRRERSRIIARRGLASLASAAERRSAARPRIPAVNRRLGPRSGTGSGARRGRPPHRGRRGPRCGRPSRHRDRRRARPRRPSGSGSGCSGARLAERRRLVRRQADPVPGAVAEVVAVAGVGDDRPGDRVDRPAAGQLPVRPRDGGLDRARWPPPGRGRRARRWPGRAADGSPTNSVRVMSLR